MRSRTLCITTALLALSAAAHATDGGWSSSGGDNKNMQNGSAWFLGSDPIRYCMEIAPGFGKEAREIQQIVSTAVGTWRDYVISKNISEPASSGLNLNFNFQAMGQCDGSEDIHFYFGVETPEIRLEKTHYDNPYAFSVRQSYDLRKGRGKGYVWFAQTKSVYPKAGDGFPDWTKPLTLQGMMLHELGHVFGNGHVEGTIMDENMMSDIQFMDVPAMRKRGAALLTQIDDYQELYHCSTCAFDYSGNLSYLGNDQLAHDNFARFMGRQPVGEMRARFFRTGIGGGAPTLTIQDESGSQEFRIAKIPGTESEYKGEDGLFRVVKMTKEDAFGNTETTGYSRYRSGSSYLGTVTALDGTTYTAIVEENMNGLSRPYSVRYLLNGKTVDLFSIILHGNE